MVVGTVGVSIIQLKHGYKNSTYHSSRRYCTRAHMPPLVLPCAATDLVCMRQPRFWHLQFLSVHDHKWVDTRRKQAFPWGIVSVHAGFIFNKEIWLQHGNQLYVLTTLGVDKGTKCINHFYIRHRRNPNWRYVSDTKYMKPLYISDSLEFLDTKTTIPPLYIFVSIIHTT